MKILTTLATSLLVAGLSYSDLCMTGQILFALTSLYTQVLLYKLFWLYIKLLAMIC